MQSFRKYPDFRKYCQKLFAGNFAQCKRIGMYSFLGNFKGFQESLTIVGYISIKKAGDVKEGLGTASKPNSRLTGFYCSKQ